MKKTASRCLAAMLAFLLGIDSAAACRWMRSDGCAPSPVYAVPACDPCCPPVVTSCCPPVETCCDGGVVVSAGCGCDSGAVVGSSVVHGSAAASAHDTYDANPTPTLAAPPEPTQIDEPAPTPAAFGDGFRSDTATTESAAPSEAWDAGLDDQQPTDGFAEQGAAFSPEPGEELPLAEPAPQPEAPADNDLFGDDAGFDDAGFDDAGFDEEVAEEPMPEDSFFDPPAEEVQPEAPADDLFGDDAGFDAVEEAPAEEPMPSDAGDLFGEGPAPVEEPMPEDDLFGDDAGFGEETPAEEAPAEDDLFGNDAGFAEEAPAESAPAQDDLFGDGGFAEEAPAEEMPAEDDLFGDGGFGEEEPAEEAPAAADPPADEKEDDLFNFDEGGDLFDSEPADAGDAPADDEADLFDFGAVLHEPGGAQSARDRTWVDNTGRFSTVGRLLAIDGGSVRLAKPTGGVATVPLGRLSQADLEFVSRQAMAMSQARDWAIAHGVHPDADAPKQAKSIDTVAPLRTAQL